MPPELNNEYYAMQNAKDRANAARQNAANTAGAAVSAGAAGGITSDAGWDVYNRMREQGRLPLPNDNNLHAQQGYATKPDGTPRFFTQEEINAMPMGGAKDMARIARGRMTIPDLEDEYNWKQDELRRNAHVTPELKPNPATQNRPIRTTPYEFLPEHMQHNLKAVFGENFHEIYNQADPRFRKYLSGLVNDFGTRNAVEILMNPDHPRNMMHIFQAKQPPPEKPKEPGLVDKLFPGKPKVEKPPEPVKNPEWLDKFHSTGINKNPKFFKAPQFPDGKIAPPAPIPEKTPQPVPKSDPIGQSPLGNKVNKALDQWDANAKMRGVDVNKVQEGMDKGLDLQAKPVPPAAQQNKNDPILQRELELRNGNNLQQKPPVQVPQINKNDHLLQRELELRNNNKQKDKEALDEADRLKEQIRKKYEQEKIQRDLNKRRSNEKIVKNAPPSNLNNVSAPINKKSNSLASKIGSMNAKTASAFNKSKITKKV